MECDDIIQTRVDDLSAEHQERLATILDEYLTAAERGKPISPEDLFAQNREDEVYLRGYLSGLNLFHNAAADLQAMPTLSHDSPIMQKPGQTVGDFRLIREVGRGGMGVVYEAEQISLKRRVALKVLPFVAACNENSLQRFKTESQIAASIEHPNITPVFAIGEEHGIHFYAMQFIEGKSLTGILGELRCTAEAEEGLSTVLAGASLPTKREGDASTAQPKRSPVRKSCESISNRNLRDHIFLLANLGSQAADGIHAAHEYGVVHRDVKPSNLLVDASGKLWITDFGLARCQEGSGLTQTGDILGTLRYMSPEQANGLGSIVDHRTDIFSLGITLYEASSLQHPFDGGDKAFFSQHRRHVKPLRHWDHRISVDFETIVMKAISELPADRYSTAAEMSADLKRFLDDKPILATRLGLINRVGKWAKRHRWAMLSAASALMVAVAALSVALVFASREKTKTEAHLRRAQKNLQQTRNVLDEDFHLAEQLAAIPGAEGIRYQLLDKNLKYYQEIAFQAANDPALVADVALAYSKIGELTAEAGEFEDALGYHQQAKLALNKLLAKSGNDDENARSLAVCMNNIGISFLSLGREDKAYQSCSEALAIQKRLLGKSSNSIELLTDIVATHTNLGLVHKRKHAHKDAAAAFERAIGLQEQLVDEVQGEEPLRKLALAYSNLASTYEARDVTAASEYYGRAIFIQKSLIESQSLNLIYQSDLAITYNNLGYLVAGGKDWDEAQLSYAAAIAIQENLVASAPAIAAYRRDLAISQNNLGMTLTHMENYKDAKDLFADAGQLQRQILAMKPSDLSALVSLGGIQNNLGILLEWQGKLPDASKAFHDAVEYQSQALEQSPGSKRIRDLLNNHLFNCAKCLHRLGRIDEALSIAVRRRNLWQNVPERLLSVTKEILSFRSSKIEYNEWESIVDARILETSLETVKLALDSGLPVDKLRDDSLEVLWSNSRFQALAVGLQEVGSVRKLNGVAMPGGVN